MPDATLTLGSARAEDAEAIARLIRDGFDRETSALFIYGNSNVHRYVAAQIAGARWSDTTYDVAREGDKVAGVAELRTLRDTVFLNYIATERVQRGAGVGSRLLLYATRERARPGQSFMALDVLEQNAGARKWYERLGFTECHRTTWWAASLEHLEPLPGIARQFAIAEAVQRSYGFSEILIDHNGKDVRVGRIGDRWFRITDPQAIDRSLLRVLRYIDAGREVLLLQNDDSSPGVLDNPQKVATTIRMKTDLPTVLERLEPR